jgi:hypothetical protein
MVSSLSTLSAAQSNRPIDDVVSPTRIHGVDRSRSMLCNFAFFLLPIDGGLHISTADLRDLCSDSDIAHQSIIHHDLYVYNTPPNKLVIIVELLLRIMAFGLRCLWTRINYFA